MPDEFSRARRRLLWMGMVVGLLVFACLGWSIWQVVQKRSTANAWVEHTRDVVAQLDALLTQLQTAETSQRGFLVTGRADYLAPYERAAKDLDRTLAGIAELTRDNPNQLPRLARLREISHAKLAEMNETIVLRRERGFDAAATVVLTDRGKQAMESFRATLASMRGEEEQLLKVRRAGDRDLSGLLNQLIVALAVLAAVLAVALVWLARWIRRLQAGLVTMCSWTRQIRLDGEWMSADVYLQRRFGINITHGISDEAAKRMEAELLDGSDLPSDGRKAAADPRPR